VLTSGGDYKLVLEEIEVKKKTRGGYHKPIEEYDEYRYVLKVRVKLDLRS